jgi:hypothetical protein
MQPLSTVLLLALFPSALSGQSNYAWWVTAQFEAKDAVIESIPVHEIDRTWAAASPLRESLLGSAAFESGESLKDHDAAFKIEGDFNRDGKRDKALVGVYRSAGGETGGFLLILTQDTTKRWTKAWLFKNPGGRFSALQTGDRGGLRWAFCLECDGMCDVIPTRGGWRLECSNL